jgi:hypothetical protein
MIFILFFSSSAGTGKTQLLNGLVSQLSPGRHIYTSSNMNFYPSSAVLLNSSEVKLQNRTGTTYYSY